MARFDPARISQMLAEARAKAAASAKPTIDAIIEEHNNGADIDVSGLAITESCDDSTAAEIFAAIVAEAISQSLPESREQIEETESGIQGRKVLGVARDDITYNEKQQQFIERGAKGEHLVLIGAAGTGKTTCQRGLGKKLIADGRIKPLSRGTKWLQSGKPGVAVLSFTNKAVNNIRHALPEAIKCHALTIHKLLEFAPVWYEIEDPEKPGEFKKTMRFEPQRTRYNPLPSELKLIIFEESSMISVDLHEKLMDACPHKPQCIYLGDIQQLPPVFGSAILGFKMLQLPVIELTEVYRQALNSPIISLAWKILGGNAVDFSARKETFKNADGKTRIKIPALEKLSLENLDGRVIFQPWQKQLSPDHALLTVCKQFNSWADQNYYNPVDDIILCPFNVSFGTIEINKGIMQHLGRKRKAVVHEIVAGYNKHYLAEGDRVLYEKEDAKITRIVRNAEYLGKSFQPASEYLDRWGHLRTEDMDADALEEHKAASTSSDELDLEAMEKFIEAAARDTDERVTAASHIIDLEITATGEQRTLDTASDVNALLGGYCITIHKAQGSEWDRVFIVLHHSHATMNQRELLYTAVTRAKNHLHIICEPATFEKGVQAQKIKGNTLAEKAEWFKGKLEEQERKQLELSSKQQEDPIQLAYSKIPEWDELARDAVAYWWKFAQKFYPQLANKAVPDFAWKIAGSAAGLANLGTRTVYCSPVYLHLDPNEMIADTIPHEVAHIVAYETGRDKGHGGIWKRVMERFGKNPVESHYHQLGKLPAALRKILEDAQEQRKGKIQDENEPELN